MFFLLEVYQKIYKYEYVYSAIVAVYPSKLETRKFFSQLIWISRKPWL